MKKVEINKKDLKYNIEILKKELDKQGVNDKGQKVQAIAVVKANGGGLGLVEISQFLVENGITYLAVATIEEVIILKKAEIKADIIMLTPTELEEELEILIENKVIITIGSLEGLIKTDGILEKKNTTIKAHIKIDTGLARFGMLYNNDDIVTCFEQAKKVEIVGMYTHFSKAHNEKWTKKQFDRFLDVVACVKSFGFDPGMLHISETTAFLRYKNMNLNAVRLGSFFQGRVSLNKIGLKEIGIFKTKVAAVKILPKGYNISYSNFYKTKKETKIAVLPIGYIDGFCKKNAREIFNFKENIKAILEEVRNLFTDNQIKVKIGDKEYRTLGKIGMYHTVIDITGEDIKVGDEVIVPITPLEANGNIKREYN